MRLIREVMPRIAWSCGMIRTSAMRSENVIRICVGRLKERDRKHTVVHRSGRVNDEHDINETRRSIVIFSDSFVHYFLIARLTRTGCDSRARRGRLSWAKTSLRSASKPKSVSVRPCFLQIPTERREQWPTSDDWFQVSLSGR